MIRVRQLLAEDHRIDIPYSSLTHLGRQLGLREPKKKQSGKYVFEAGSEMQHDTTIYKIQIGNEIMRLSCAGLILGYSRMSYIQFFPRFTRFEALFFLTDAFQYMGGVCKRCTIDNTSVLVAEGSGPDAIISEKVRQFGVYFGTTFIPHAIGHADRKAHVERLFSYVEGNFLSGRTFSSIPDLNKQAKLWCDQESNVKAKRSLGMSPNQAIISERPFLIPLPDYIPPIYESQYRIVDIYGNVHLDTNRYSVPYQYIGQKVEVQKHIDSVIIYANRKKIAQHSRIIDGRNRRMTDSSHRSCELLKRKKVSHVLTSRR
ncbi:MAG: integrase family protein [Candidatus Magnetoglobus multicellularis str. Araruama]|uniref:Integrase family protein n=1 Tax=Candidatus Magnetoglobus multicellularis str. Araruama TaxID=890399 RepID=A0A1V1P1Y6_9BACT|nr:MAG: integrase family protein [Candidatus Magnetoglobus multicellularis str. Araruama]